MEFINPMLPDRLSKHTILKNFFIFTASLYILNETIYLKHFFTPNVPSDTTLWRSLPRHYVQRHAFSPHTYILQPDISVFKLERNLIMKLVIKITIPSD
jgi:hypothetical protein